MSCRLTPPTADGRGGAITINTNNLHAVDGDIITQTNLLNGGAVNITGATIALTTGSTVVSSTGGNGHAGPITITATDHPRFLSEPGPNSPSGIFSNSSGLNGGTLGNAGDILVMPQDSNLRMDQESMQLLLLADVVVM